MANEITLTDYREETNRLGDTIRSIEVLFLFPVASPVAGVVPTPSADVGRVAGVALSQAQKDALDAGTAIWRKRWLRITPKLRNPAGDRIDPPPATPTAAEIATRVREIYASLEPVVAEWYTDQYRLDVPELPVPLGTQINATV